MSAQTGLPSQIELGDGYSLTARDRSTVEEMHELTVRNLERLREWEGWAQGEQTVEGMEAYTDAVEQALTAGTALNMVIRADSTAVGSASLRFDRYQGNAELGYWIDEGSEGRGIVRRACAALLGVAREQGMARVEIRTGASNDRSRALAKRLGFEYEGTLRSALRVGRRRQDAAVFGLVLGG